MTEVISNQNCIKIANNLCKHDITMTKLCSKMLIYILREVEMSNKNKDYKIDIEQSVVEWSNEFLETEKILK